MPAYRKRAEAIRRAIDKQAAEKKRKPPVNTPADLGRTVKIRLTPQEFNHILAGLRSLQESINWSEDGAELHHSVRDIATNSGKDPTMTVDELDDLCEDLNLGGRNIR